MQTFNSRARQASRAVLLYGLLLTLLACAAERKAQMPSAADAALPAGATIEPTGFATVLRAPASAAAGLRLPRLETEVERFARERGVPLAEAERMMNPPDEVLESAFALDLQLQSGARGNYVGMRVVHDPDTRVAFQFREDAAETLARFTSDSRFTAKDGGIRREELEPLFNQWRERFEASRIFSGGYVMELAGVVLFDMPIDEASYRLIAAREGWVLPPEVELHFPPPQNPRSIDDQLVGLVRLMPRQDHVPGLVLSAGLSGRLVLRDGCFWLQEHGDGEPLALFGRDVEVGLDDAGYMIVINPRGSAGSNPRVGERIAWSGPRGVDERDEGVKELRAACGPGPVVAVGEPESEASFESRPGRRATR